MKKTGDFSPSIHLPATDVKIEVPDGAKAVLDRLTGAGFEAYVVGGCVRDSILGRTPEDFDITTNASPRQVKGLFRRTIDTGIQHGTVTVMTGKKGYEVTTYRIDGAYSDARHPDQVTFVRDLKEDLRRRDFTINAMAYHPETGLVDLFGGLKDLRDHVIRSVGKAKDRFEEDALRMLRAIRFAAQLGFTIESDTYKAIQELAPTLSKVSEERIQAELVKILISAHPEELLTASKLGILSVILPELDRCIQTPQNNPHHCYSVGIHILHSVCAVRPDKVLRLTMLLHDIAKPLKKTTDMEGIDHFKGHAHLGAQMAKEILKRLKFDNHTISRVCNLIDYHDDRIPAPNPALVRKSIYKVGVEAYPDLLEVKRADTLAQSDYQKEEKLQNLKEIEEIYRKVLADKDCLSLKDLAVKGGDLKTAGITAGRQMGLILQFMLLDVLKDPSHNTREYLLSDSQLKQYINQAKQTNV